MRHVFSLSAVDFSTTAALATAAMGDNMDVDMDIDLAEDPEIAQLEAEAMNIVRTRSDAPHKEQLT